MNAISFYKIRLVTQFNAHIRKIATVDTTISVSFNVCVGLKLSDLQPSNPPIIQVWYEIGRSKMVSCHQLGQSIKGRYIEDNTVEFVSCI